MAYGGALPPWDRNNPQEQEVICHAEHGTTKHINDILSDNRTKLIEMISPDVLLPHLRVLKVVDSRKTETIKLNATTHNQVDHLIDHILRGPSWRFHALLRACALTDQKHVILELGFDPQEYMTVDSAIKETQITYDLPEGKYKLSSDVNRVIKDHARECKRKLMKKSLFAFDDDPTAEIINVSKCFIQVQAKTAQDGRHISSEMIEIPEGLLLRRFGEEDSPQLTRLDGPPGAGKTTYMRHLVHQWSEDFLNLKGDSVILDKENGPFSMMVYLSARSIGHSVMDAIKNALWCKKEDKDILLNHVETGEGVAIVVDAIDEVRNEAVIEKLENYVKERQGSNQRVFISTRTNLCKLPQGLFDRTVLLQGFTLEQAMEYVKCYFWIPGPLTHPVLQYIGDHQKQLQAVLSNPLRLHIFCELTSRGLLELDPSEDIDVIKLFKPLEDYVIKREMEKLYRKGSADYKKERERKSRNSEQFYLMCLYGMLNDIRDFSEDLLNKFDISQIYRDAFLTQHDEWNAEAEKEKYSTFQHEMLYEVFATYYLQTVSDKILKSLILTICSKEDLRNVQKITSGLLTKQKFGIQMLQTMIRGILILQNQDEVLFQWIPIRYKNRLLNLKKAIAADISTRNIVLSHQHQREVKKAEKIWKTIDDAFDSHADDLQSMGWFQDVEKNGTISHIVDCLQMCSPEEQEQIIKHTVHQMLPSQFEDINGHLYMVYAIGPTRWGKVELFTRDYDSIFAWSPEDASKVIQTHFTQQHKVHPECLAFQIDMTEYNALWGIPEDSSWSQQAWTSLLQALINVTTGVSRGVPLRLFVPTVAPLNGLLTSLLFIPPRKLHVIEVHGGRVDLKVVEDWRSMSKDGHLKVKLRGTNIVVPQGVDPVSLRPSRDRVMHTVCERHEKT